METEFTKAGMLLYLKENLSEVNILPMYNWIRSDILQMRKWS